MSADDQIRAFVVKYLHDRGFSSVAQLVPSQVAELPEPLRAKFQSYLPKNIPKAAPKKKAAASSDDDDSSDDEKPTLAPPKKTKASPKMTTRAMPRRAAAVSSSDEDGDDEKPAP
eukprot:PhM_4_TR10911/c0_g1_i1/m.44068